MLNKVLISILFLAFALGVNADVLKVNPDHPDKYVVVKGDTLWDISARFLEQPWRWPEIWNVNPQIANPHLIYPGDVISMSYQDGKPVLSVQRGGLVSDRNVKLSPQIRSSEHAEAIPTIPIDAIAQFLERPLVLDEDEMNQWPYVVSSYDQHLIATTGNTIYVRGIPEDDETRLYSIYRKGKPYINPSNNNKEVLGYEAIYIGDAILEKPGDPASALITAVDREVLTGDRLLPQSDDDINSEFMPRPTDSVLKGQILSVVDGVSQVGQYQIIVLNLGVEQGIEPGNILGIYQSGKIVKDNVGPNIPKSDAERRAETEEYEAANPSAISRTGRKILDIPSALNDIVVDKAPYIANQQERSEEIELPEEYVGVAMVFRTFNKVSYALVMETQGAIHVLDSVRSM